MDATRRQKIQELTDAVRDALNSKFFEEEQSCDVLIALVANAASMSKVMNLDENEFFDMVVKVYEWTHVETIERH